MALPKQVAETAKRVEDLVKQMNNPEKQDSSKEQAGSNDTVDGEKVKEEQNVNVEPPKQEGDQTTKPQPKEETVETLKHKLSVLQGKYNKEIKAVMEMFGAKTMDDLAFNSRQQKSRSSELLQQVQQFGSENVELKGRIKKLEDDIKMLSVKKSEKQQGTISDADMEYLKSQDLGDPKILDILKRAVGSTGNNDDLLQMVESLKNDVNTAKVEAETAKKTSMEERVNNFWRDMRSAVPDIDSINIDPAFLNWLAQPISEFSPEITRQSIMSDAGRDLDSAKAIRLFKAYIDQNNTSQTPRQQNSDVSRKLEKQVEPSSSAVDSSIGTPKIGKNYTAKEIAQFYKDMATSASSNYRQGPFANRRKDAEAMDADIKKAAIEGRIK